MKTAAHKLAWRFATGAALDGKYRTDASWLHWSTATLWPHRVVRWHHMPRLWRGAVRDAAVAAAVVTLWGLRAAPVATGAAWGAVAVLVASWALWWAYRKLRHFLHHRRYVRPLRRALIPILEGAPPRLAIEPSRSEAKIWLPPGFIGADREWEQIDRAVSVKLGIEGPVRSPQLQGAKPYVIYTRSEPPPLRVTLADIRAAILAAAEHEVIIGIGKKDELVKVSLDSESPHLGISMTTGAGKSTVLRNIAAQLAYHGAVLLALDYKLVSHMWARGLPNVAYAGTIEEIHAALCWLGWDERDDDGNIIRESELTRRKKVVLAGSDLDGNVHADVGPRILVAAEELNATQGRLKAYWRRIGGKGPSPASEALDEAQFIGRQVRVNVVQIGQRLSAKATSGSGSADSRENLGVLLFSDPSPSTWKMLVGDRHVLPPASGHVGRLLVVTPKDVRETQGAWWTAAEAREFATAGTVADPRLDMPFVTRPVPVAAGVGHPALTAHEGPDQAFVIGHSPDVPSFPGAITLREAAEAGLFPSKDAAHRAALRAGLEAVGERGSAKLYRVEELATCQPRKAASADDRQ